MHDIKERLAELVIEMVVIIPVVLTLMIHFDVPVWLCCLDAFAVHIVMALLIELLVST